MTDVITVVDATLATEAQTQQVVQVGYIAQTVQEGGGTPASTVTSETTYGIAPVVGVATAYARQDHTHGTPALGSTASTAAAGNHAHTGVYDPAGTAAAAVTADRPRIVEARITTGDITLPNTAAAWQILNQSGGAPCQISVPAVAGEYVDIAHRGMRSHNTSGYLDLAVVVGGSIVRYLTTGTGTPAAEGDPALYPSAAFHTLPGARGLTVASGDLSGGTLTIALAVLASGTGTLYASATYPWYWRLTNLRTPA